MQLATETAEACAVLCENNVECMAFTYIYGDCYLKKSNVGAVANPAGLSGTCE